jgi:uncharacterized protein (DUF488 family)
MLNRVVTIGAYGFNEQTFFASLREAGVDTFCDLRFRRGVRGREYAFVNSRRLQTRLAELGICYKHFRDLAPDPVLRARQAAADKEARVGKRQRTELSPEFVRDYCEQRLGRFDSAGFVGQLGTAAKVVALFCVEREPAACHRSLVADRLHKDMDLEVIHLGPG